MKYLFTLFCFLLVSFSAFSSAPVCSPDGYCSYTGKVERIYINDGNLMLIYFDAPTSVTEASKAGLNISNVSAAAYSVSTNSEFAKLFYSTALSAQATDRNVSIQMHEVQSGYLKFDRIWLAKP